MINHGIKKKIPSITIYTSDKSCLHFRRKYENSWVVGDLDLVKILPRYGKIFML